MRKRKLTWLWITIILVIIVTAGTVAFIKRDWIVDFFRGIGYTPSGEMLRIQKDLDLTEQGEFVFKASQPVLSGQTEFNEKCRRDDNSEVAVLGCYLGQNIYVYNIDDKELDGIRELTTAHELLHAIWARMSEDEKIDLVPELTKTFEVNQALLEEEINNYPLEEKQEELYVRAGTEIKNLPAKLEDHYAKVFKDQDKIVDFYEKYISVFNEIADELERLGDDLDRVGNEVDSLKADYEHRIEQLKADVISFNACAEVSGCFKSETEFYKRRKELIKNQETLDGLYQELADLVDEYNGIVKEYNENVLKSQDINQKINSNKLPEGIK